MSPVNSPLPGVRSDDPWLVAGIIEDLHGAGFCDKELKASFADVDERFAILEMLRRAMVAQARCLRDLSLVEHWKG